MIRAIMFDFGQTLVDSADAFRTAERRVQEKLFQELGHPSWPDFLHVYRRIRSDCHAASQLSRKAIWQKVYASFDRCCPDALLETWERDYWQTVESGTHVFPETESVLQILASHYPLALITNTQGQPGGQNHRLASFPQLKPFFAAIIVAGEGGIPPKPDSLPFQHGLRSLGMLAEETLFIGDDWHVDICGARNAGLHPVWLKHQSVRRNWPDTQETVPVLTSLTQVFKLLPEVLH